MTTHTQQCIEETQRILALQQEYDTCYSNWCRTCHGVGYNVWYEDVVGDGGPSMPMSEPCYDCVAQGKCPRCGHQHDENWQVNRSGPTDDPRDDPCENCDWSWGYGGRPELDYCDCGEDAWRIEQEELEAMRYVPLTDVELEEIMDTWDRYSDMFEEGL
jgi:hypothetical protein